jgi:hypothetical protein
MSVMASHYNRGCPGSAADVPQCLASPAYQNSMSEGQDGDQQAAYGCRTAALHTKGERIS